MTFCNANRLGAGFLVLWVASGSWQAALGQRPSEAAADPFAQLEGQSPASARPPQQADVQTPAAPQRPARSPAVARIEQELNKSSAIDVVEMPLKDCVLYLSENHRIPIALNFKKLEEEGVSADTPVTKSLRGISLRSVLNNILADLGCAFVIKDEVLQITTADDARLFWEVRVYDCRDLLGRQEPAGLSRNAAESQEGRGTFGGRGRMSEYDQRVSKLVELLKANVDAHTWRAAAEDAEAALASQRSGAASEFDGLIVVTQSAQTHEKVERLLSMLREAAGMEVRQARVVP